MVYIYFRYIVEGTLNIYSIFEVSFYSCPISKILWVDPPYASKIGLILSF